MTYRPNVFPDRPVLTKHRSKELLSLAWARVVARVHKGAFADRLGVDVATVENAMSGKTMPAGHTLLGSLAVCRSALDEPLAEMGLRIVPVEAVCDTDTGTLPLAALLHKVAAAEAPDSPGGKALTHTELLDMKSDVYHALAVVSAYAARIRDIELPKAGA